MTPCLAQCRRTCDLVIRTRSHVPGRAPQSDTTWARCACTEAELFMIKKYTKHRCSARNPIVHCFGSFILSNNLHGIVRSGGTSRRALVAPHPSELHTKAFCTRTSFGVVELDGDWRVVLGSAEAAEVVCGGVVRDVLAWLLRMQIRPRNAAATPSFAPILKACGPVDRPVPVLDPIPMELAVCAAAQCQELVSRAVPRMVAGLVWRQCSRHGAGKHRRESHVFFDRGGVAPNARRHVGRGVHFAAAAAGLVGE